MEEQKSRRRKAIAAAGRAVGVLLSLAVLCALYLTLVIAQPQPDGEEAPAPMRIGAAQEERITSEGDLRRLIQACPGPAMSFMSGSGMTFVSGETKNVSWQGGAGRMLTLYWQTVTGQPLILRSIYPPEALELMGRGDYAFSDTAGPTLFGLQSVRMENADTIRVHVQAEGRGLYVLIVPASLRADLPGIARSIQLFTAE